MDTRKVIDNYLIAIIIAVMAFIFCVITNYTYVFAEENNSDYPRILDYGFKHYAVIHNNQIISYTYVLSCVAWLLFVYS